MIILINGALGVGKTETSWALHTRFDQSVMLDGDYIGAVHPFEIYDNARIEYLHRTIDHLIEFHQQHGYHNFVVNYVFETPEALADLRRRLIQRDERVYVFRLVCAVDELARRVRVRNGDRLDWQLARARELTAIQDEAAQRGDLGTPIDTTGQSVAAVVETIWHETHKSVEIVPYNPAWANEFAAESARVRAALGNLAVNIHHIGSTSVPGLAAKPITDLMVTVRRLDDAIACIAPLQSLGYTFVDHPQNTDRRFFKKGDPRTHHLHIVEHGGTEEWRHVAFRDALRADDRLRDDYAALKIKLAEQFTDNRPAYTDAKTTFVETVLSSVSGRNQNNGG